MKKNFFLTDLEIVTPDSNKSQTQKHWLENVYIIIVPPGIDNNQCVGNYLPGETEFVF